MMFYLSVYLIGSLLVGILTFHMFKDDKTFSRGQLITEICPLWFVVVIMMIFYPLVIPAAIIHVTVEQLKKW